MTPSTSLESRLAENWPPSAWQDVGVVVAISGGADSVALLRALHVLKHTASEHRTTGHRGAGRLTAAHFNHQLRGEAALADERFVTDLCQQLHVPLRVGRSDVGARAASEGDGLEAAARDARYDFLQATAEALGARYVATAHTADDQVETILHRALRGTSLAGLAGIPRLRPLGPVVTVVRPILDLRRSDVEAYLAALGQPFREDETNRERQFTRNRIRHELLPLLAREYNSTIVEALLRLGALAADAQAVITAEVLRLADSAIELPSPGTVVVRCDRLTGQPRHLVRELLAHVWRTKGWPLQAMGYAEWELLAEMAGVSDASTSRTNKQMLPGAIAAIRDSDRLILRAAAESAR